MINLAGSKEADRQIQKELYLAGIPVELVDESNGEVKYHYVGRIGNWVFRRAWTYWVASMPDTIKGLSFEKALALYNKPFPIKDEPIKIFGDIIRCGGHCGGLSPAEYGAYPIFNDDFKLECKLIGVDLDLLSYGEISALYVEGKLKSPRFVNLYHIDNQIGLGEFASAVYEL